MADNPIWERLPSDTDKSFEAFCIYRDMGSGRTLRKLAQELDKTLTQIGDWSSKHNWIERVSTYDDYLRDEHRKRLEKARLEVAENVLDDYKVLRKAVAKRLKNLEDVDWIATEEQMHSLLGLMHRLDDYARRAVGLPSEIKESKSVVDNKLSGTVNVNNRQLPPLADDTLSEILHDSESID